MLGTLADLLAEENNIGHEIKLSLCLDVAKGLRALHNSGIIHSDVKSENILIFRDKRYEYIAKIGDFGCSIAENPNGAYLNGGSPPWTAPEWTKWIPAVELCKTDVYSFGLLVWRVMSGAPDPFRSLLDLQTTSRSVLGRARIEELKNDGDNLLWMLEENMSSTLTAKFEQAVMQAVIQTLRHTVRRIPVERGLDIAVALLSSVVQRGSNHRMR